MKTHIEDIDSINGYIDNTLTNDERLLFERKSKTDKAFNALYQEHLTFLEGMKRVQLKEDILAARKSYIKTKWIKHLGMTLGVILVSILIYNLFFKANTTEIIKTKIDATTTINDSNAIENKIETDSVKKYVLVYKRDSTVVNEKETKKYGGIIILEDIELISYLNYSNIDDMKSDFPEIKNLEPVNDTIVFHKKHSHEMVESKIDEIVTTVEDKNPNEKIVHTQENPTTAKITEETNMVKDTIAMEIPEALSPELIAFYKSIKKAPQVLTVNVETETTLTCKEGTILTFAPKSFVYKDNNRLARGRIKLEITEYYKLSDMLLANLSTKSDENILETGGMLFIKASKNGKELKLADTKTITIAFPDKNKQGMQLFSGILQQDNINWKLTKQSKSVSVNTTIDFDEIIEEDIEVAFNVVENVPTYPGCENATNNRGRRKCLNDNIQRLLRKEFNADIAEDLKLTGKIKISVFFKIDKEGEIVDVKARASHKALAEEAVRVVNLIQKMQPAMQRGKPVRVPYYLPINIKREGPNRNFVPIIVKGEHKFTESFEARMKTDSIRNIKQSEIERYSFAVSNLGWINCDRFARMTGKRVRYRLKVKDAEGANLKMVFKSISSILPSRKYRNSFDFGIVPEGEEISLVAIKKVDNKIYLGTKDTETKKISELDLNFKEVSLEELKKALQALNDDFN